MVQVLGIQGQLMDKCCIGYEEATTHQGFVEVHELPAIQREPAPAVRLVVRALLVQPTLHGKVRG